jgi:hypothetical protein
MAMRTLPALRVAVDQVPMTGVGQRAPLAGSAGNNGVRFRRSSTMACLIGGVIGVQALLRAASGG